MSCLEEIKRLFQHADGDGNGMLSFDELRGLLLKIGTPAADIPVIFGSIDKNGDGVIDWSEFVSWAWEDSPNRQESLVGTKAASEVAIRHMGNTLRNMGVTPHHLFSSVDLDRNGYLNRAEFFRVMQTHDPTITSTLMEAAFSTIDSDSNGWISCSEFVAALDKDWTRQEAEVAAGTAQVMVQVPANTWPGQLVAVQHAGNTYNLPVPANQYPGSVFTVTLQLAPPRR